ncbi:MAG TPA: hypothetical protein VNP71_09110 [Thermoplasmata archaeon]|nr:hypothetical protein [Thermoplasmata archaeon]
MDRDVVRRVLIEGVFVVLAGFSMGALVSVASFADYGLLLSLDVGGTIIFVALGAGIAIGLRLRDAEPQYLVLAGFVGSSIAIIIVLISVYAPVFAGVVAGLEALGPSDSARAVIIFVSLFLIPLHLVGCVAGYALADFLAPEGVRRGRNLERL